MAANADIATSAGSMHMGLNQWLFPNMATAPAYATEFRSQIVPLAPYGQALVEVTMNGATSSWGECVQRPTNNGTFHRLQKRPRSTTTASMASP